MISTEGLSVMTNSLILNETVREVNLYGNNICSEGSKYLSKLLAKSSTIKSLILNWNNLGRSLDGFSLFCEGLSRNESLEYLDLKNNQLCSTCGKYLSSSLLQNQSLKILDLRWNRLKNEGVQFIQDAILKNTNLSEIYLKGNFANSSTINHAEEQVKYNESIASMKLDYETKIAVLLKKLKENEASNIDNISRITEQAHHKIIEMGNRIEETMEKLLVKEQNLKKEEKIKAEIAQEVIFEKQRKIDIMKQLEKVKKANIELREYMKMKEAEFLGISERCKRALDQEQTLNTHIEKELNEKCKLIEKLKEDVHGEQIKWESHYKQELGTMEKLWESRLKEAEETSRQATEDVRVTCFKEFNSELLEKERQVESLRLKLEAALNETIEKESEVAKWKSKANSSIVEIDKIRKQLEIKQSEVENLTQELRREKSQNRKTKENNIKYSRQIDNLKETIQVLQTDLSNEKLKTSNLSNALSEMNSKLLIEREEEKLRSEFLAAAMKSYLSSFPHSTEIKSKD